MALTVVVTHRRAVAERPIGEAILSLIAAIGAARGDVQTQDALLDVITLAAIVRNRLRELREGRQ